MANWVGTVRLDNSRPSAFHELGLALRGWTYNKRRFERMRLEALIVRGMIGVLGLAAGLACGQQSQGVGRAQRRARPLSALIGDCAWLE